MGLKIVIVDDVLTSQQARQIVQFYTQNPDESNLIDWYTEPNDWQSDLMSLAQNYFDLSESVGFESWAHVKSHPDWHIDQDEIAKAKGIIERPLCSIVYYPLVKLDEGGQFMTETEIIQPKTNRAIIFAPGVLHKVAEWKGSRVSVAINPWKFIPYSYRHK